MKFRAKHVDMTVGTPWKQILWFSLPLILGNLLQELYSVTDSAIVSQFVGLNALAAISGTEWVRSAFLRICMDCSMAFGISASQRVGAGNWDGFREVLAGGVKFGIFLSIFLVAVMMPLLDPALRVLQIQENIYGDARLYLLMMTAAIPLSVIYNMTCAFLRAAGDSRTSFYAIVCSTFVNLGLDILFVAVFHWGIAGAASATILAQAVSVILVLWAAVRDKHCHLEKRHWRRNPELLTETTKLWVPMFANSLAISISGIIAQSPINASGSIVAAGIGAGVRIYCLLETSEKAVVSGIGVFVGQNMGAKNYDRIREGMRHMAIFSMLFSVAVMVILWSAGDLMVMPFLNQNQPAADLELALSSARTYLRVQAFSIFLMVPMHFFRSAIQAMGHVVYPLIGAFLQILARWMTVVWLPPYFGLVALCMPDGTSALATLPLVIIPYLYYIKKLQAEKTTKKTI